MPAKKTTTKKPAAKKTTTKKPEIQNGAIAVEDEISKSFLDYAMSVICLLYTSPSPRD